MELTLSFCSKGNPNEVVSIQQGIETATRAKCAESVIGLVHKGIFGLIKKTAIPIADRVEVQIRKSLGAEPEVSLRERNKRLIAKIRDLLNTGARERQLQSALFNSGLLRQVTYRVVQEVTMKATKDFRGMRIDLVLAPNASGPAQIIELKRGTHVLLAREGTPNAKRSKLLIRAIKQLEVYGDRLATDEVSVANIESRYEFRIINPALRLIAGRSLRDAGGYSLLRHDRNPNLYISSWDGFLEELERLVG